MQRWKHLCMAQAAVLMQKREHSEGVIRNFLGDVKTSDWIIPGDNIDRKMLVQILEVIYFTIEENVDFGVPQN